MTRDVLGGAGLRVFAGEFVALVLQLLGELLITNGIGRGFFFFGRLSVRDLMVVGNDRVTKVPAEEGGGSEDEE